MKDFKDRLRQVQEQQRQLVKEYNSLLQDYQSDDLIVQNEQLHEQVEAHKQKLHQLETRARKMEEENARLRMALSEQMLDEKLNLIRVSQEKMETYFRGKTGVHNDRLEAHEHRTKINMNALFNKASEELQGDADEFKERIAYLAAEVKERIELHRQTLWEREEAVRQQMKHGYEHMAEEGLSEETIQRRIRQNRMEMKIGLSWINKVAILLIILGVGAAFQYSYSTWFNDEMKGGAFFLLGVLMLAGGEWLFRRKHRTFAMGLLGGGISVLFGSIFYSYFLLHIIGLYTGLGLSVLVSAVSVLLSLRYQSRTICSLGLVGGYLPLFSYMAYFGLSGNSVYVAMIYLLLLNGIIVLISFGKRWPIVHYISFLFNTPSMLILLWLSPSHVVGMGYAVVTFALYLGITLAYPFKHRVKLTWWDFALLAMNTSISCLMLYVLFDAEGWDDAQGLLALIFCLVYFGLARWVQRNMVQEKQTLLLFYITSLTFAILMIPFQFGAKWLSMGWLIEGILLVMLGHLKRFRSVERAGWGVVLLCVFTFVYYDVLVLYMVGEQSYFMLKYSCITLGALFITLYYAMVGRGLLSKAKIQHSVLELGTLNIFKYATLGNLWLYVLYESNELYTRAVEGTFLLYLFYKWLMFAALTIALAYGLSKAKVLHDRIVQYYTTFLHAAGCCIALAVTLSMPALEPGVQQHSAAEIVGLLVLIIFNVGVFFAGRDLLIAGIRGQFKSVEWYPVIAGVYLLGVITVFLTVQFQWGDIGLMFSLVYLLLAILYIAYGFRRRYVMIRRLGLGLTLFSTGKMVFYDVSLLTTGSKIIAYFSFGVLLLGISYLYQKVSSRMEEVQARETSRAEEPDRSEEEEEKY
ncbi:DUF2339 domain-containing protein [Paenibacillus xylanilyticus]|uniref:DUF2339 domain-containing protein n=1 Tax=Paenibacillus xylanilyticus TaxID=248903 RepID=A0A7Y6BYQ2_9BACL|nr:DUF2339 domain-containing protein [Paenibacillus xylanilyticus]NUU77271.1 DUF2339 domain-containing protein [Paenibacillus xylanilyticus]